MPLLIVVGVIGRMPFELAMGDCIDMAAAAAAAAAAADEFSGVLLVSPWSSIMGVILARNEFALV